jgi:hypothetical protein
LDESIIILPSIILLRSRISLLSWTVIEVVHLSRNRNTCFIG